MAASLAFQVAPSLVQDWRDALSGLKPKVPPCPGLTIHSWPPIHEAALDFLDRFGAEAIGYGWNASELFGVHPQLGTIRSHYCGALVFSTGKARGVTADQVLFLRLTAYRNVPGASAGTPIWEFR